jgi:hypothetical protein
MDAVYPSETSVNFSGLYDVIYLNTVLCIVTSYPIKQTAVIWTVGEPVHSASPWNLRQWSPTLGTRTSGGGGVGEYFV